LTKRGKFQDREDLMRRFHRFSEYCQQCFGSERWKYVAVSELHSDGESWHMHVALKGFYWVGLLRRLWSRALGGTGHESGSETLGNVDIVRVATKRGAIRRIAKYLSKYLAKGARTVPPGKRMVNSSVGIGEASTTRWREPLSLGLPAPYRIIRGRLGDRTKMNFEVSWWHYGGSHGFTINSA
jgi:hypothetical protein